MVIKTSAHYQREYRKRLRQQGLVKKEIWIRSEHAALARKLEKDLREVKGPHSAQEVVSGPNRATWRTGALYGELVSSPLVHEEYAHVELIDGVDASVRVVMHEFGDLPIYMTVSGDQIVSESVLWLASDVVNQAKFNETVLRMHKYIPLSNICLAQRANDDYYLMFGSLSATSSLDDIIHEIEVLATNVIHTTEAFSSFLKSSEQRNGEPS